MPANMMNEPVGSRLYVTGSSSATVIAGPIPGSTPMTVPSVTPISANSRFCGVRAWAKPSTSWENAPIYSTPSSTPDGSVTPRPRANTTNTTVDSARPATPAAQSRRSPAPSTPATAVKSSASVKTNPSGSSSTMWAANAAISIPNVSQSVGSDGSTSSPASGASLPRRHTPAASAAPTRTSTPPTTYGKNRGP